MHLDWATRHNPLYVRWQAMSDRTEKYRAITTGVSLVVTIVAALSFVVCVASPLLLAIPSDPFTYRSVLWLALWLVGAIGACPVLLMIPWSLSSVVQALMLKHRLTTTEMRSVFLQSGMRSVDRLTSTCLRRFGIAI